MVREWAILPIRDPQSEIRNPKCFWRRGQDSNLQALSGGGFQDRCTTNYATPPQHRLK